MFLSTKAICDGTEQYVGQWVETDALPAGSGYWRTNQAQLPVTQSGAYYLIFETDTWNSIGDSNLSNNVVSLPVTVHINPPDLAAIALQAPSSVTSAPYPTIKLVWGVTNQGAGAISGPVEWYDLIRISTNDVFPGDPWGPVLGYSHETNSLPAGGSYWRTNEFQLPITESGAYYLWLLVDAYSSAFDANYSNNFLRIPINLQLQAPDLAPTLLLVPDLVTGTPHPSVSVVIGVTNQGIGPAPLSLKLGDMIIGCIHNMLIINDLGCTFALVPPLTWGCKRLSTTFPVISPRSSKRCALSCATQTSWLAIACDRKISPANAN